MRTISPSQLNEIRQSGRPVDLIDVRPPVDYRSMHVAFARNVPMGTLDPAAVARERNAGEPLYVICRRGVLAGKACRKLIDGGYANVVNVEGGTEGWEAAGLPVVRDTSGVSLERQVRIAAGFLVLLGVLLGFVHPAFFGLSAFVGAGLMFAGITDTCGMGMLLAKMPWNQVREKPAATTEECATESNTTGCCA